MASNEVSENGWTAVPVDAGAIFKGRPYINEPEAVTVNDVHFPSDDPIVAQVQEFAKKHLPRQTYNHSMRVFYFCTLYPNSRFRG
jgi:cyanamide hydratase